MIPEFYGYEDGDKAWGWLISLEQHFQPQQIEEADRLNEAVKGLRGCALNWYKLWSGFSPHVSWWSFDKAFIGRYIPEICLVEEDEVSNKPENRENKEKRSEEEEAEIKIQKKENREEKKGSVKEIQKKEIEKEKKNEEKSEEEEEEEEKTEDEDVAAKQLRTTILQKINEDDRSEEVEERSDGNDAEAVVYLEKMNLCFSCEEQKNEESEEEEEERTEIDEGDEKEDERRSSFQHEDERRSPFQQEDDHEWVQRAWGLASPPPFTVVVDPQLPDKHHRERERASFCSAATGRRGCRRMEQKRNKLGQGWKWVKLQTRPK